MNATLKNLAKKYSSLLSGVYYHLMNNKVRGRKGNTFTRQNAYIRGLRLYFGGKGNSVVVGGTTPSTLAGCDINVYGSNNKVVIEEGCGFKNLTIYMGGDNNTVHIKRKTMIAGKTELAVMEGTKIVIGEDSLFSANVTLRAGDSHSVIDAKTGERLNQSKDIIVGDHVWIGNTVIVTKGTVLGNHSVVATGSVVTGKTFPGNCAIGGNPGKVVKEGVSWLFKTI